MRCVLAKSHIGARTHIGANRLFMYQDEDENETEDESFRSFWIKPVTNKPGFITIIH